MFYIHRYKTNSWRAKCIHCAMSFYVRNLSILSIWCFQGTLVLIIHMYTKRWLHKGIPRLIALPFTELHRYHAFVHFYKLKVCGNPVLRSLLVPFFNKICVYHILVIFTLFKTFHYYYICLVISDEWFLMLPLQKDYDEDSDDG